MSSAYISKVGFTKVGDHWSESITELAYQASKTILDESPAKPEALIVANAFSEVTSSQSNLGPLVAGALGLEGVDSFKVESSGASGAAALHAATNMISSGQASSVLVLGVEKMRDLDPAKLVMAQGLSESSEYLQYLGVSFTGLNAILARMYMNEYDISRHELSAFPVISHNNSSTAEHAQFRKRFSAEDVSRSELVSDPLRILDCAPVGDGAAAILLGSEKNLGGQSNAVKVIASECSSGQPNIIERERPLHFVSTESAARKALKKGGLSIEDIDFFEIHDSYSIIAALSVEALGLSKVGKACSDAASGKFDLKGAFPICTFGGMKGRGYPVGAAGIYQVCEAYLQLKRGAGANQVPNSRMCLIHSLSGIDSSCFVHILASEGAS